jgi:hypothetical protein
LPVDLWTILKWILIEMGWETAWTDQRGSKQIHVVRTGRQGNQPSRSTKCGEFQGGLKTVTEERPLDGTKVLISGWFILD